MGNSVVLVEITISKLFGFLTLKIEKELEFVFQPWGLFTRPMNRMFPVCIVSAFWMITFWMLDIWHNSYRQLQEIKF
jgi:hypothetical protein